MLIVLEGCDGTGKSTLAEALASKIPGAVTSHHGPYLGMDGGALAGTYAASMKPALDNRPLILDRSWLSEPIYSKCFRGAASRISAAHQQMLERIAHRAGAVVIHCHRPFESVAESFAKRKGLEYLENESQLKEVFREYTELYTQTSLPVIGYDFEGSSLPGLINNVSHVLSAEAARAKVTLVGEKANVRTHAQAVYSVPFVSFSGAGCSEWLAEQLIDNGISERSLRWENALTPGGQPTDLQYLRGTKVIALGRKASEQLSDQKVSHRIVSHPQAHKRFHFGEPYDLMREIKRALL